MNSKRCQRCKNIFYPTGKNHKRCSSCSVIHAKEYNYTRHLKTYERRGYNQRGENNNNWKGGIGTYRNKKESIKCERCGSKDNLLIHHRDHDRYNNETDNLECLCKRCHQIEHKCHRTLPKGEALSVQSSKLVKTRRRNSFGRFE